MSNGTAALGGLDGNLAAALGYPIGIIALLSVIMEKENKFVKFHAFQSLIAGVGGAIVIIVLQVVIGIVAVALGQVSEVLGMIVWLLAILIWFLWLALVAVMIFAAVKAYGGNTFKLPIVGNIAEGLANK
jgi:uncharacterized membrane protein